MDNEEIKKPIRFLREREIVHYQRFAEALEFVKAKLDKRNYYKCNSEFNCKPTDLSERQSEDVAEFVSDSNFLDINPNNMYKEFVERDLDKSNTTGLLDL